MQSHIRLHIGEIGGKKYLKKQIISVIWVLCFNITLSLSLKTDIITFVPTNNKNKIAIIIKVQRPIYDRTIKIYLAPELSTSTGLLDV